MEGSIWQALLNAPLVVHDCGLQVAALDDYPGPYTKYVNYKLGMRGRGLLLFTVQLNVSAFCGIGGVFRGCVGRVLGVSGGTRACQGVPGRVQGCILCQKRLRLS